MLQRERARKENERERIIRLTSDEREAEKNGLCLQRLQDMPKFYSDPKKVCYNARDAERDNCIANVNRLNSVTPRQICADIYREPTPAELEKLKNEKK